ncbi:MAG: tRNA (N6-isopentenyl adenosine(37)-C2)-methylthiotransferase MiaB [Atopobiaceae bacterium]|jgi:tRNA-2-methylthio-N6-dimethylallyladenosine synthase|nr:tRNA (N6-isopentenyl adenosine(37)-C2)-methylthiotransferase MiaB [Atopobiaceae bacterium]MCH4213971.1 tRNA (N6-isopentenyl adenosine(37)-C2)-methylthiotransferase MiaB [Atopobiaceae bacterium]MCH4275566.1 tRNA (N6-isopentenyl adenosine(37)-C2)-methylthiotransferase MiaB [Atopobiaceae bacterium]MCI1226359.1 tRNA (N6-isopentenyl adenosine(37)-C2)-methylthiotransferase MiaB [Atopobiaceae bacterium]MCI1260458.1 tRNA (N6-isopentenyl adenosine(37)-C2)-methylthiotransferase MiaB [Atopobiaceae bact
MTYPSVLVGLTYFVRTFGCQMNLHDSERVSGLLDACGCLEVGSADDADIVVFMTCCVREKADTRLYGNVTGVFGAPMPPSGRRTIAIGGCIAQRDGENLREHLPNVDVVFGTGAIQNLPHLLAESRGDVGDELEVDVSESSSFSTDLPSSRATAFHAWVPIMYGCNNFCSYCIVPYVRGRERSRDFDEVVQEVDHLVADGVREVCLLGQNVNSYGRDRYGDPRFAELLRAVGATGIERIRFTSSHPKDLTDDTIAAMAETPSVMPQLHLAVQSGSTRVLKAMNRHYTREDYLALARRIRAAMPGIALTTDLIVGFPGETETDFDDTMSLVSEADFDAAFTFIYSRRDGTPAARIEDDTPQEVIQDRFDRLARLVEAQSLASNRNDVGGVDQVLVEGPSKRNADVLVGHSEKNQTVLFSPGKDLDSAALVGSILPMTIDEAHPWYLKGTPAGDPR